MIDLGRSIPPPVPLLQPALRDGLRRLSETAEAALLRASVVGGPLSARQAAAAWLATRFGHAPDPARVLLFGGTQTALALLMRHLVPPGEVLLAEGLSYGVLTAVAARAATPLRGLPLDEAGVLPEAFAAERGAALYLNPTLHNPTAATMPIARRLEIAEIARRRGLPVIEDEPAAALHPEAPPPLAVLAPDIAWHIAGLTKSIAQGLRIAIVVAPDAHAAEALAAPVAGLSAWHPAPLHAALAELWLRDGTADAIAGAIRAELAERHRRAAPLLAGIPHRTAPGSLHVWVPLPPSLRAGAVADTAAARGVAFRTAARFAVEPRFATNAVRLSLSAPDTAEQAEAALRAIAPLLTATPEESPCVAAGAA